MELEDADYFLIFGFALNCLFIFTDFRSTVFINLPLTIIMVSVQFNLRGFEYFSNAKEPSDLKGANLTNMLGIIAIVIITLHYILHKNLIELIVDKMKIQKQQDQFTSLLTS
jgi:hypothetical protein